MLRLFFDFQMQMICKKAVQRLGAVLALALFGTGCAPKEPESAAVLTTILPWYCVAASVAGEDVEVANLLPANVGPHDYQLKPGDLRKIQAADLIVLNGLGLDDWLSRAIEPSSGASVETISEALDLELIENAESAEPRDHSHHGHSHGDWNPHIWMDPEALIQAADRMVEWLARIEPSKKAAFRKRADAFIDELKKLDGEMAEPIQKLADRRILTYHDALPYFARRYGLEIAGVIEEVPDVAPSAKHMSELYELVREERVKAVFIEPQFPGKFARRMSEDLGVKVAEFDPLETGEYRPDAYARGMRKNLQALLDALK